jgi:RNA-directed DNA polymerase
VLTPEAKLKLADRMQPIRAVQGHAGQTRVHPEEGQQHQAPSTRNSRDSRQVPQARVVNALEPEWEARFEPRSYGFRPGRGCHDAIEAIYLTA